MFICHNTKLVTKKLSQDLC